MGLLLPATLFVAFTNGANANSKGVASLYGSGTTGLRAALAWGTAATFAGGLAALFFARGLIQTFSGKGLVPDALTESPDFLLAVALGGAFASFLATRLSFPVSTTHALTGALLGAGLASGDHTVRVEPLLKAFVQPLLLSPLLAVALGASLYFLLKALRWLPGHRTRLLDTAHFLSAGAASFARGLNDTPKMAALLAVGHAADMRWAIISVAVTTALGGILDARNVARTLGEKVTGMNPGEGFAANLATALLVSTASYHGLPVSTTHVSVGSLLGVGAVTRQVYWGNVGQIFLSWLITVPCGALLAALAVWGLAFFSRLGEAG
jgi:PiT family inorganic phosphate transporter